MRPDYAQMILDEIDKIELHEEAEEANEAIPESLQGFPESRIDRRVKANGTKKTYDIQRIWCHHKEMLQLKSLGYTCPEIAQMTGFSECTVRKTISSDLGRQALLDIRSLRDAEFDQMRDKVMELTWMALDIYDETFTDPDSATPKERRAAARDVILEMSGLRAPTQIQSHSTTTVLTSEELDEFKDRGRKASLDAGKLIDIPGE